MDVNDAKCTAGNTSKQSGFSSWQLWCKKRKTLSKILTQSTLGVGGKSHRMCDAWGWHWLGKTRCYHLVLWYEARHLAFFECQFSKQKTSWTKHFLKVFSQRFLRFLRFHGSIMYLYFQSPTYSFGQLSHISDWNCSIQKLIILRLMRFFKRVINLRVSRPYFSSPRHFSFAFSFLGLKFIVQEWHGSCLNSLLLSLTSEKWKTHTSIERIW